MIVDAHANPPTKEFLTDPYGDLIDYSSKFFRMKITPGSIEEMLGEYAELKIDRVILHSVNTSRLNKGKSPTNEQIFDVIRKAPDKLSGLCSLDLKDTYSASIELEHAAKDLNLLGLKISPMIQGIAPNDKNLDRVYETCVRFKIPVFIDWGNSAIGITAPGGGGVKLSLNNPMHVDDVAAEFPDLTLIGCHVAWPWIDEMLAVLVHKANVFCVLSGWYPRAFSSELLSYIDKRIPGKFMFGTEYPVISPQRWLAEFDKLELLPETKDRVLGLNAQEILGLQ